LRRFLDVCNAIDYAHARGVLHRDIKPGNVIVGKYGETLVVDWGMAKPLGKVEPGHESGERTLVPSSASGTAATLPGSALGTPAYMSPEQAVGELDKLGPRSDVYSLGATLYCLLTGRAPFDGEVGEVLRGVGRGEFPRPRQLDPTIDSALEAVCLKAMALKPEDRYPTARALADDVERWTADEPVTAWREPFPRRARRWARRNRPAVWAGTAAVLMALAGTAIVLVVQTQANRHLRAANDQVRQERDLARRNFDLAQRAVDEYLTRVGQNALLKEEGFHDLRQELLVAALRYYQDFLRERSDDPGLRLETALAHERVGNILDELDRHVDALAEFDEAVALIEPLARMRPTDAAIATARIRLESDRFQVLSISGRNPEALAAFERTLKLWEAEVAAHGATEELTGVMARTFAWAASILRGTRRVEDAVRASRQAHEFAEQAVSGRPGDLAAARSYLEASWTYAELQRLTGRVDEAHETCIKSLSFAESLLRQHPRDFEIRQFMAFLNIVLAGLENTRGRPSEVMERGRKAADIAGALAREYPMSMRARFMWASSLTNLNIPQSDNGLHSEAEQSARMATELFEGLSREFPSHASFRYWTAVARLGLIRAQLKAGKGTGSLAAIHDAVKTLEESDEPIFKAIVAGYLAIASTLEDPDEGPAGTDRRRRDADHAMSALRQAIALGWSGLSEMKIDRDFDPLRGRADFQAILMDLAFPDNPFAL
jgi:serine/threonine-protein kinase